MLQRAGRYAAGPIFTSEDCENPFPNLQPKIWMCTGQTLAFKDTLVSLSEINYTNKTNDIDTSCDINCIDTVKATLEQNLKNLSSSWSQLIKIMMISFSFNQLVTLMCHSLVSIPGSTN